MADAAPPQGAADAVTPASVAATARNAAERSFKQAIFYKPREDGEDGREWTYAPLIVQEVAEGWEAEPSEPFGALTQAEGRTVDRGRPTVYVSTSTTRLVGHEHDQVTYAWRYPLVTRAGCLKDEWIRGVRITLGADGMPLVWEALSTDDPRHLLFVSKSLEEAARREFGDPLPGRMFSVERSVEDAPETTVARALDDGPVPMGPYVYLSAAPRRDITTVLCRCMPSQVDEFVATRYYDLAPRETVERRPGDQGRQPRPRPAVPMTWEDLTRPDNQSSLDSALRWPKQAP